MREGADIVHEELHSVHEVAEQIDVTVVQRHALRHQFLVPAQQHLGFARQLVPSGDDGRRVAKF